MTCAVSSFEAQAESYKRVKNSVNFSNNYQGTICMRQLFGREAWCFYGNHVFKRCFT